jgi:hypothetical protein
MKKKFIVMGVLLLALIILGVWAIPAFAADASNPDQSTQNTPQGKKIGILVRLLMVQDENKVDAFLAKAEQAGKITTDQVITIKQIWTKHHEQFKRGSVLVRLLRVKDGNKVQALLEKAVGNQKISQPQADKILKLWQKLHGK